MTVQRVEEGTPRGPGTWVPEPGSFTDKFLGLKTEGEAAKLTPEQMDRVVTEAGDILGHCRNPADGPGDTAVLVVGYVQSGKTLSFTSVAALARDNGFGIVVVLAGTTKNLKKQSEDRLDLDLGLTELQSAWTRKQNPVNDDAPELRRLVESWKRRNAGLTTMRDKPAVLITVLKHAGRIRAAAGALRQMRTLLQDVPALIIDDESDQASLNTKARENLMTGGTGKSQTYDAIVELRESLPHHSYLQYTATPQANLLLAISDVLNPSFAKVIESGDAYTGGRYFFVDHADELIVPLSASDVCDPKNMPSEAPESLQQALRVFLLGAAAAAPDEPRKNRSMMVQASQDTAPHATYERWIQDLLASWAYLMRDGGEQSKQMIRADFQSAYQELSRTVADVPPLDELLRWIPELCDEIRVIQVNSKGAERDINWTTAQFWILVGGLKLDRGFTVEGLTVTYMPRNLSGNADVLQQRARFFGYRAAYIGYCRVYLPRPSIDAFTGYVRDEEYLRRTLTENGDRPLGEWRRQFLLNQRIRNLSRSNIAGRKLKRLKLDGGWSYPKEMQLGHVENRRSFSWFEEYIRGTFELTNMTHIEGVIDKRADSDPNLLASGVSMEIGLKFLLDLSLPDPGDQMLLTALTTALGEPHIAEAGIDVVFLSDLGTRGQTGRSLSVLQENLFIGRNPSNARGAGLRYSGDRTFKTEIRPTLQLRSVLITNGPASESGSLVPVPWVALHVPSRVSSDFLIEEF